MKAQNQQAIIKSYYELFRYQYVSGELEFGRKPLPKHGMALETVMIEDFDNVEKLNFTCSKGNMNFTHEYMWIPDVDPVTGEDNGYYEQIDSTSANLDNYYTKTEIDAIVTTIDNTTSAISGRVTAIETELGNHNWKYAGSATEGGAATKIVETSKDTDSYQDILLANSTHESAEYAASSAAQINPSTGTLKVNAISLGEAILTYDAVSESVVVNY